MAVVAAALERAPVAAEYRPLARCIHGLRVVGRCACGCDTVDFAVEGDEPVRSVPVAEAIGQTPAGGTVGLIVWGTLDRITGLEVYDAGVGDDGLRLPLPSSLIPVSVPASLA